MPYVKYQQGQKLSCAERNTLNQLKYVAFCECRVCSYLVKIPRIHLKNKNTKEYIRKNAKTFSSNFYLQTGDFIFSFLHSMGAFLFIFFFSLGWKQNEVFVYKSKYDCNSSNRHPCLEMWVFIITLKVI